MASTLKRQGLPLWRSRSGQSADHRSQYPEFPYPEYRSFNDQLSLAFHYSLAIRGGVAAMQQQGGHRCICLKKPLRFISRDWSQMARLFQQPPSLEEVMENPENRDGVAILIAVKTEAAKAVRANITLPEDVLEQIDRFAEAHGFTRSGFLTQAAKRAIEQDLRGARWVIQSGCTN